MRKSRAKYQKTYRVEITEIATASDPAVAPVERKVLMQELATIDLGAILATLNGQRA